jgi:glyoxalase family protein
MNSPLTGIHHVTAIGSDLHANVAHYSGVLGLRLVKKTVNFDDPSAYHLYYGDETGAPGSIVTFFFWPSGVNRGRVGPGQSSRLSFSAAPGSLDFWLTRLQQHGIAAERRLRFGEETIAFADPDGIPTEIVAVADDHRPAWTGSDIPAAHALRGLHTVELTVRDAAPTERLLGGEMGWQLVRRTGNRARFAAPAGTSGTFIDLIAEPEARPGRSGVGTIHHVAWSVPDDAGELRMHGRLIRTGLRVSPVLDRNYFHSIYYREPGGILFEIATATPGFPVDEPVSSLGTALKLPAQFEPHRAEIERILPPLPDVRTVAAPRPASAP